VTRRRTLTNVGLFSVLIIRNAFKRNPTFSPVPNLLQSVLELEAFLRKLVFNPHWGVRDYSPGDQFLALKGAKALGQHPIGEVWNRSLDGSVARFSLKECLKNCTRPAATDELDSPMKAGAYLGDGKGRISHKEESTDLGA
jgi:hypothetical protein